MISKHDAEFLLSHHFLDIEVLAFAEATNPDGSPHTVNIDGPAWRATIKSRQEWYDDKIERGWSEEQIERELRAYYDRDLKRTPWDFLKAEYRPPKRIDYWAIVRSRHKDTIKHEIPKYYSSGGDIT